MASKLRELWCALIHRCPKCGGPLACNDNQFAYGHWYCPNCDGFCEEEIGIAKSPSTNPPKIRGYVARDEDGTLHFFSSDCGDGEPIFDTESGTWGVATMEMLEIVHPNGEFGELSFKDEPIEVELLINKV